MSDIQITRLKYPDTVRMNVGMYLSGTESYTVPLREIINNAEDELLGGHANLITIINKPEYKLVTDNGRGIPVYADPENPSETVLLSTVTDLHAGSKLGDTLEFTSGTHGVGSSAVNAVSDNFIVIRRIREKDELELPEYLQKVDDAEGLSQFVVLSFERGVLQYSGRVTLEGLQSLTPINPEAVEQLRSTDFMTAVYLVPDLSIYRSSSADVDELPLKISLIGRDAQILVNGHKVPDFSFSEDIANGKSLFNDEHVDFDFKFGDRLSVSGFIGFAADDFNYLNTSLVNLINNANGGLHEKSVARAFGTAFNAIYGNITASEAKWGLITFVNMFSSYRTSFNSQTKDKLIGLGMSWQEYLRISDNLGIPVEEVEEFENYSPYFFYESEFVRQLTIYFKNLIKSHSKYFDQVAARISKYKASLHKLTHQEEIKAKVIIGDDFKRSATNMSMAKVYEASGTDWLNRELFITEGTSASGGLVKYRNTETQSVLPLRGKTKNSASMQVIDFVNNEELLAIINTIGCGIGEIVDVEQSRYGKVIIATDADIDGLHISNLITSIFLIHAPEFIKQGRLFKLEVPFYCVNHGEEYYYTNEKDKVDFNKYVERRKGLGSYTEEEVKKFMVNTETRKLVQITWPEDAEHEVEEARRLLYSSYARRELMERMGIFDERN